MYYLLQIFNSRNTCEDRDEKFNSTKQAQARAKKISKNAYKVILQYPNGREEFVNGGRTAWTL